MSQYRYRQLRRIDLFLVRVWRENIEDAEHNTDGRGGIGSGESGDKGDSGDGKIEWRGSVQRVVDGESHQFSGWQGLTDLLLAMVSKSEGR